jgi:CRISPR system Cascade subunit CasA
VLLLASATVRLRWDPRFEACMPVLTKQGPATIPLVEVFAEDEEIAAVHGETPGETVAMLEFLLAIAHAADCYPETHREWRSWVERREPLSRIADWLRAEPDACWNLFDQSAPLGQNPDLIPHLDRFGVGPAQLFIDRAGDYNQLFDRRHLHDPEPVDAAAAWRAMLTQHAYGPGGRAMIKAKDMGLPAALTNQAVARLGGRVRVLALGESLADTLRLNLTPDPQAPVALNYSWNSRPRRTFTSTGSREARAVTGPADLHSILGRSIALRPVLRADGTLGVDRVLMGAGELLGELPAVHLQDAVTVTARDKTRLLRPDVNRDLWRESHSLYAAVAERTKGTDLYVRLADLPPGRPVKLWAVGLIARQTKITTWVSDSFPYVPGREEELRQAAEGGSQTAEYAAKALYLAALTAWQFAYPSAKPADKERQVARFNAQPELWAATAWTFHTMLDQVASGTSAAAALAEYGAQVRQTAITALDERLVSLPATGRGLRAKVKAERRLAELLAAPHTPPHLKAADTEEHVPEDPAAPKPPSVRLAGWLHGLVRAHDNGALADLRRRHAITDTRLIAARFADQEAHRPVYEGVAYLFARYHQGTSEPQRNYGDLGDALRRIGSARERGPENQGVARLMDRVIAPREIPWRHLQLAIERARADGVAAPSWHQLAEDLIRWNERGRPVQYRWARSFYTPTYPTRPAAGGTA